MKLIPKAKPVKIRIMSGGKEHSSVESLRKHFDINDVKMLLDGRLARWLRQLGENDLAASVSEFSCEALDSKEGCVKFIKIFFGEDLFDKECSTLFMLASYWDLYKKEYEKVWRIILRQLLKFDKDAAIALYKKKNAILSKEHWRSIFSYLQKNNENDAELLNILDCMQNDDVNGDKRIGIERSSIEKTAESGNNFIAKNTPIRFYISYTNQEVILKHIEHLFNNELESLSYLRLLYPGKMYIPEICSFAEKCKRVVNDVETGKRFIFSSAQLLPMDSNGKNDWFYKEKIFIRYFIDGKSNLNSLKEIAPFYPPANWLVENKDSGKTFEGIRSDICFDKASPRRVVEFVFAHIFEY